MDIAITVCLGEVERGLLRELINALRGMASAPKNPGWPSPAMSPHAGMAGVVAQAVGQTASCPATVASPDPVAAPARAAADARPEGGDPAAVSVSSLKTAPAASASKPPATFSRTPAGLTVDRLEILRRDYQAGLPMHVIRPLLEALPGPPLPTDHHIRVICASRRWLRPADYVRVYRPSSMRRPKPAMPDRPASPVGETAAEAAPKTREPSVAARQLADDARLVGGVEADWPTIRDWSEVNGIALGTLPPDRVLGLANRRRRELGLPPFRLARFNAPPEKLPHPHVGANYRG